MVPIPTPGSNDILSGDLGWFLGYDIGWFNDDDDCHLTLIISCTSSWVGRFGLVRRDSLAEGDWHSI